MTGGILVAVVVVIALLARFVSPYPPIQMSLLHTFAPPQASHLLGTDEFGRDVLSRVFDGARASLLISLAAVLGAMAGGGTLALVVGYVGGALDVVFTRVVDILLAIPALLIALGVVALAGPSGTSVAVALAVAYAPTVARVVRSAVVAARVQPYVEASVGMGARTAIVLLGDILPNILPVLLVQSMVTVAWAILDEASLGFLGLGVQPPNASWGSLLIEGREYMFLAPWLPLGAGVAVLITVIGFNLLGDGLRDVLDPRATSHEN
jgi:peptide/nickel transport system permease protein